MKVQAKHGKVTQNMHGANRNYRYVWDVSKPSRIDVIKHAFWSSSSRIAPTIVMWWSAFRTSSSSSHRYSDVPLIPLKLMIGSVPSSLSLVQHMLLPMTRLYLRYTSWKVLLFSGGRTMLQYSQMVT